jgi:hypothetical protein
MRELDEAVLAELDKLEALPQVAWDQDLVRFREFLEETLPPGESYLRFAARFATDPEFSRLTMRAMLASLDMDIRKRREEAEAFRRQVQESYARCQEEEARELEEKARKRERWRRPLRALLARVRDACSSVDRPLLHKGAQ